VTAELPGEDELWDLWTTSGRGTPEEFARSFPGHEPRVAGLISGLLALRASAPPESLVPDLPGEAAGDFAGFRLVRTVGEGAFGRVFEAVDPVDGERVALKVLNPLVGLPGRAADVIEREAAIARSLDHPGILRIRTSGRERGYAWIASEYIEGRTLAEVELAALDEGERRELALRIGSEAARALAHAHARDVVHRDLKPENLMLDEQGRVRLLDFGLARTDDELLAVSATGHAVGTPIYMAPEQARGERGVGPAADVYALGLILLEVASGRRRRIDRSLFHALLRVVRGYSGPERRLCARLEPGLRAVVRRCLEVHPADRYASAGDLADDLEDLRVGSRPRGGALSGPRRWLRRAARNPGATVVVCSSALLVAWMGWRAWWHAPVPVRLDSLLSGKILSIDGERVGLVPLTTMLSPGRHTYALSYGEEGERFQGTFEVPHREPAHELLLCNYWPTTPMVPGEDERVPPGEGAYVHLGTQVDEVRLELDGELLAESAPGIVMFRAGHGAHRLRVSAGGYRARELSFDVTDERMRMLAVQLDTEDDPWTTLVAYSPVHEGVRAGLVSMEGLRPYVEYMRYTNANPVSVHRAYLGPSASGREGELLLRLELPFPPAGIEVTMRGSHGHSTAWLTLEMGPSPDDLELIGAYGPEEWLEENGLERGARQARPAAPETMARLVERMGEATELHVRYHLGDAPAGDAFSYAYALRSEAIPLRPPGEPPVWEPALVIRVRR
jgi:serine/threonine protein kinase